MGVEELVGLFMNNGVAVGCLIYFMVYNNKQLSALNKTMQELKDAIKDIK